LFVFSFLINQIIFYLAADVSEIPDVNIPQTTYPISPAVGNQPSMISASSDTRDSYQDDIRLCTITRNSAADTYGIELIYHKRDQYHSLKLRSDLNTTLSSKHRQNDMIFIDSYIYRCSISWCKK
jgi:hypothetical protein